MPLITLPVLHPLLPNNLVDTCVQSGKPNVDLCLQIIHVPYPQAVHINGIEF